MAPKQPPVKSNSNSSKTAKGDTKSTLTEEDVNKLVEKYQISSFSALAAGDATINNPPEKCMVVYEQTLSNGLVFPLSSFISSALGQLCVPPGLLVPNAVRVLVGFEMLCFYHEIPCDANDFVQLFRVVTSRDQIYFRSTKSLHLYHNAPDSHKGWKDKFFFLEYFMWMYPDSPLNKKKLEKNQLEPDVQAKFQACRVMDLSEGWDFLLVMDYLKLAKESMFKDYSWPSESDRLQALSEWRKAFEQRSVSREEYEKIVNEATVRHLGEGVGETYDDEQSSTEEVSEYSGAEEVSEGNHSQCVKKRRISEIVAAEEPAPTRAIIHSCSNFSDHARSFAYDPQQSHSIDLEGHTVELDGVSGQMLSGGLAGIPVTPLNKSYFSQNMLVVGEGPPRDLPWLAAEIGKISEWFLCFAKEHDEKLVRLKEALDLKTVECRDWEDKFNLSLEQHQQALLKQEEQHQKKLMLALSKEKEYEKLLNELKSDFTSLKEQKEEMGTTMNEAKGAFDILFAQCMKGLSYIKKCEEFEEKITWAKAI